MSFFKDFKEDLSQAVNELVPGEGNQAEKYEDESEMVVNTLESELDVASELSKLDGLLEKVTMDSKQVKSFVEKPEETKVKPVEVPEETKAKIGEVTEEIKTKVVGLPVEDTESMNENSIIKNMNSFEEDKGMSEVTNEEVQVNTMEDSAMTMEAVEVSDEVAIITEGTSIKGNMESTGSLDIRGVIDGNVQCNGKLVVTGTINGNSTSSEFFADAAKIEGEVVSTGTVKIGLGSVVIGNISATSAVIAGAIKGDIDVQGPVVVDTSAVIMGNIKSRSVQINNGAVIEGFCSQCYADIDVESLFGDK